MENFQRQFHSHQTILPLYSVAPHWIFIFMNVRIFMMEYLSHTTDSDDGCCLSLFITDSPYLIRSLVCSISGHSLGVKELYLSFIWFNYFLFQDFGQKLWGFLFICLCFCPDYLQSFQFISEKVHSFRSWWGETVIFLHSNTLFFRRLTFIFFFYFFKTHLY